MNKNAPFLQNKRQRTLSISLSWNFHINATTVTVTAVAKLAAILEHPNIMELMAKNVVRSSVQAF